MKYSNLIQRVEREGVEKYCRREWLKGR